MLNSQNHWLDRLKFFGREFIFSRSPQQSKFFLVNELKSTAGEQRFDFNTIKDDSIAK